MILYILRGAFILLAAAITALYVLTNQQEGNFTTGEVAMALAVVLVIGVLIVGVDTLTPRKRLSSLSGVFLGLIGGLVVSFALSKVVDLIPLFVQPPEGVSNEAFHNLLEGVKVLIGLVTCYIGISLVIQTKDDFRFVIPYVEFAKQVRGNRPTLLDSSVIIDGRILDIVATRIVQGTLVVPKFVLNELQLVADSADKLKRTRGRRGLDVLQKLQDSPMVDVAIEEADAEGGNVDQKLVSLAQEMSARVMTNDFNLNKIATLRGVDVINLNDLAKALRPVVLPGESMHVKIIKPGEAAGQGVGYLDDGTMVVVENARAMIGQEIDLTVTSTLQTSAGRMIFGRSQGDSGGPHQDSGGPHESTPGSSSSPADDNNERTDPPAVPPRFSGRNPRRNVR